MKEVRFIFRGVSYRGFLAASTEQYPHYYWCFIDDPQLVKEVGDCISFQQEKGGPLTLTEVYPKPYQDLIEAIKGVVTQNMTATATA